MACGERIPLTPLQPCEAYNSDVKHVFIVNMCLSLSIYSDPMGEEHHIRRTSGVPPLMVVVSVILLYFTASLTALKSKNTQQI